MVLWFSQEQMPVLGRVTSVDPTSPRPVTVQVFEPQTNATRLHLARFQPATSSDLAEPLLARLTLHQILMKIQPLTSRGFLTSKDRKRLVKCLTS